MEDTFVYQDDELSDISEGTVEGHDGGLRNLTKSRVTKRDPTKSASFVPAVTLRTLRSSKVRLVTSLGPAESDRTFLI